MKKIDLNSWYVYNNKLDIYLKNIYANIEITPNEDNLCQLQIVVLTMSSLVLKH